MRIVYRADNIIDAHLVSGLLQHEGIRAFVTGKYLTGGIGELPAAGLVAVMVDDSDWPAARAHIEAALGSDAPPAIEADAAADDAMPDGSAA